MIVDQVHIHGPAILELEHHAPQQHSRIERAIDRMAAWLAA
ncbi:MAG: hypothetical protein OXF57_02965 [Rhodospirillaceae bacterium]|nr:hypothetical protein [Rhodospirillaceae bacterium]